jgi:hypothetical protein
MPRTVKIKKGQTFQDGTGLTVTLERSTLVSAFASP